jgi:hypothetical protein
VQMRTSGLPVEDRECAVDIGVMYAQKPCLVADLGLGLGSLLAMLLQMRGKEYDRLAISG